MSHRQLICIIPALLLAALCNGCQPAGSQPPLGSISDPYRILLLGSGKRWRIGYPVAKDRPLRFVDVGDGAIRVPAALHVELVFKSSDYIYTFAVPECGIKEVAVPDLEFRRAFCAARSGQFELISAPMCGESHSAIQNRFVVQPRERFLEWLDLTSAEQAM